MDRVRSRVRVTALNEAPGCTPLQCVVVSVEWRGIAQGMMRDLDDACEFVFLTMLIIAIIAAHSDVILIK